jgi:hypothetical protein
MLSSPLAAIERGSTTCGAGNSAGMPSVFALRPVQQATRFDFAINLKTAKA